MLSHIRRHAAWANDVRLAALASASSSTPSRSSCISIKGPLTPDLRAIDDRQLTADRTVVSVTEIKDKQILGFIRDDIAEQLEVEERMIETVTRVEFIPANEVEVNETFKRKEYIGDRDVTTRMDIVESQDRNISADREFNISADAFGSQVAVGRFFEFNESVGVNESVVDTYIIVEFIDQEQVNVVDRFERGLADLTRTVTGTPEAETDTDRQVIVERSIGSVPIRTEDSADENLLYIETVDDQWEQSYTTDLNANFSDSVVSNFNTLASLGTQVNATSNVTQEWLFTDSKKSSSVSASERIDMALDPTITVYQRFALGKDITSGEIVKTVPVVERKGDDIVYTPIGSDQGITQTITGKVTADTSQLGLSILMIMVILAYLGRDYYRKRKIVRLYKADKMGELTPEQREKAERYLRGRTGV